MNAKTLGILAAATAVVGGLAAVALWRERAVVAPRAETGLVLPGLGEKVNDASAIEITTGDKSVTVHRDGAKADALWTVKELGEYTAKFEKVKGLLVGLSGLEKVEARTDQAESYEKIGVQDPAAGNMATLVRVSNASGPAASLIVGKSKPAARKPQVYVRIPEQKQSWLAEGDLGLTADPLEWVDREIAKIDSTRMKSVRVAQPDGAVLSISRAEKTGTYAVEGVPEGRALKNANIGSQAAGALAYLSMDGVRRAGEVAFDEPTVAEYRTFDGLMVTVSTVEANGQSWARLVAAFDESAAPPTEPAKPEDGHEPTEEEKAAAQKAAEDARQRSIDTVKKEVETLNGRWGAWAFQVPKAKADQLGRKMEDLLAEVPKEGPEDEGTPEEMTPDDGEQEDPFGGAPEDPVMDPGAGESGGG